MNDKTNILENYVDNHQEYYTNSNIPRIDPRNPEQIELDERHDKIERCVNVSVILIISTIIMISSTMFIIPFAV